MKLTLVYVIALVALSASEVLSISLKKGELKAPSTPLAKGKHEVKTAHKVKTADKVKTVKKEKKEKNKDSSSFCDGKPLSHGKQLPGGSCSPTIQGDIPSAERMTSTLIISPENGAVLEPNQLFSVDVLVKNLDTGHFSDPETEYNALPQTLHHGLIQGHSHITIQRLIGNVPPRANEFAFFKGLEDKDNKGLLTAQVIGADNSTGLDAGAYRICTMAGSFTHQPLVMPIAKRGSQDDCIRIRVGEGKGKGKGEGKGKGKGKGKGEGKGKKKCQDKDKEGK
jgi:hypothetical protein